MKEILITGSNGYLGKNLVKYLYKKKLFKIRTLSRKKTNKFKNNIKQITYKNKRKEIYRQKSRFN